MKNIIINKDMIITEKNKCLAYDVGYYIVTKYNSKTKLKDVLIKTKSEAKALKVLDK